MALLSPDESHWKLMICPMVELVAAIAGSVQFRETLWEATAPLDKEMGTGGGALDPSAPMVMMAEAEVVDKPLLSVAFAVMTWDPALKPE
jgi:hypothetical protein